MTAGALHGEFWHALDARIGAQDLAVLGTLSVHLGSQTYRRFSRPLPAGFKPVLAALMRADRMRVELVSDRTTGVDLVRTLRNGPALHTLGGSPIEPYISRGTGAFGRLAVHWHSPGLSDQSLWPTHHAWLLLTMADLIATFEPMLTQEFGAP